jgi:hypothetical protein
MHLFSMGKKILLFRQGRNDDSLSYLTFPLSGLDLLSHFSYCVLGHAPEQGRLKLMKAVGTVWRGNFFEKFSILGTLRLYIKY